jgi:RimJ/RimL family protein N-acetyltransferase
MKIPILKGEEQIGWLKQIDRVTPQIVEKMTKWREKGQTYFLTQFYPTIEKTTEWLQLVLSDKTRMMFIISANGRRMGQIGVRDIQKYTAEIDNVIRGEKGCPSLMYYAELALLEYLFSTGINTVYLHVFSTNLKAIRHYQRVGYREIRRNKLRKIQDIKFIFYHTGKSGGRKTDIEYIKMKLSKKSFEEGRHE